MTDDKKRLVIGFITGSKVSQSIAMLDFLGYPQSLRLAYSLNKEQIYKHIAFALGSSTRTVRGNLLGLNPHSKEDTYKYPAVDFQKFVKDFYLSLLSN